MEKRKVGKVNINTELFNYDKALYIIDMNNGFVNFGAMANTSYNALIPHQLRMVEKFRKEGGMVNFILEAHEDDALEFKKYPIHCLKGSEEAKLVKELAPEEDKEDTYTYYKNSINGMLNDELREDIKRLKALREIVIEGVCADLCVMDFARTLARYLDEVGRDAQIFVVKEGIDTFDAEGHNRDEWMDIACKVMEQAGIEVVETFEDLENREQVLGLRKEV